MEFDILNELLTSTVAQLFTDIGKHSHINKNSSQMGQDKSEIPKSQICQMQELAEENQEITTVDQWLKLEAKQKMIQYLTKLGLDQQKVHGKHLQNYSIEDLQAEKKKVKNELKNYDQEFMNKFNRVPGRQEKEPLRNLYIYYKRLKQYISKKEQAAQQKVGYNTDQHSSQKFQKLIENEKVQDTISNDNKEKNQSNQRPQSSISQISMSSQNDQSVKQNNFIEGLINPEDNVEQMKDQILLKYNLKNLFEIDQRYQQLKVERKELRLKLDEFQKNFENLHNRKIRYTKDISPVNQDFKRYKELKTELGRFEQILQQQNKKV